MDTFELLPSLAQGELRDTSSPELVAAVFRSRASGTLWLETVDGAEVRIFFRAGDMCGSGSFSGFQTLAHVLLANDWVNALDIDASRTKAEVQRKRHGEILVSTGVLTPDQLRAALAAQHRQNLATVLAFTEGKYDWRGWEPPPAWAREVVVDPVGCIADALANDALAPRRQRILDWLGRSPARLSVDWPDMQGRIALDAADRRAAALLALPRRFDEFLRASRLPQVRAEALLVALLLAGGVEPQPEAGSGFGAAPAEEAALPEPIAEPALEDLLPEAVEPLPDISLESTPADAPPALAADPFGVEPFAADPFGSLSGEPDAPAAPFAGPDLPAPPSPPAEPRRGRPPPRPALLDDLPEPDAGLPPAPPQRRAKPSEQEAMARLDSLSLDDLSPPDPEASAQQGPHDELELATGEPEFPLESGDAPAAAPARAFGDSLDGSPDEPIPGFESPAVRSAGDARGQEMRKKLVARGLRNMGAAPSGPEPVEPAPQHAPLQPVTGPIDVRLLTAEDRRFVEEVRSRARLAPSQTAYARLGVSPQAPSDAIKAAYIQAAKRFHPDRASGDLEALQPELQSIFTALKEAYDLLGSPDARTRYDQTSKAGASKPPPSRRDEAALVLKMGDVLLKKRDFEAAIAKLRRAVELDPNADALAALAWSLVCDPRQPASAKEEAASLINRALRAPGVTARTYYVAGVLWRTKDPESAVDAFRKTLELEPSHPDASLELRLLESRRGKAGKADGGGVLSGLLFGKRKNS